MSFSSPNTFTHSGERQIGGDDGRAALITLGQQVEEQFTAARSKGTKL